MTKRYLLSSVLASLLLSACSEGYNPVYSVPTDYFKSYELAQNLVSDPQTAHSIFEQQLAKGNVHAYDWDFFLEAALKAGSKEQFRYFAGFQNQIKETSLKKRRRELLAAAASAPDSSMLDWLLKDPEWKDVGFDLNAKPDPSNATDLSVYPNSIDAISFNKNQFDSVLMLALPKASQANLDWMIQQGADINQINGDGDNVLNIAVNQQRKDIFEFLLGKGLSIKSEKSRSPLLAAISSGNLDWVAYLIDKGADLSARYPNPYLDRFEGNSINASALTLLMDKLDYFNFLDTLQLLLQKGATPDKPENAEALQVFLSHYYFPDKLGSRTLDLLIKNKANLNLQDAKGRTPLMSYLTYAQGKPIELMQKLLEAGADPKAADSQGKTVLMYAAESNDLAMVQQLLFRGLGSEMRRVDNQGLNVRNYANGGDVGRYLESIPNL